ncbi:hypothetical protein HXX76_011382 [Chlamydomonas incerta]|uniref:Uncharacterized protein n=1 Tax=Chlamydomonas incerta TaxID=51695 RepID=A0A835SK64_CHLIN|nr:hypothetical protein HXX76_011382 [Chlamydomonas incerta]|eukprot:KAG2428677.1 hypothetical protein HXX76_011382 [Chlamydomonas incerta]
MWDIFSRRFPWATSAYFAKLYTHYCCIEDDCGFLQPPHPAWPSGKPPAFVSMHIPSDMMDMTHGALVRRQEEQAAAEQHRRSEEYKQRVAAAAAWKAQQEEQAAKERRSAQILAALPPVHVAERMRMAAKEARM